MSRIPNELKDEVPSFEHSDKKSDEAPVDFSALSSIRGVRSLGEIARLLGNQFDAPLEELEADVLGFADELLHRRILALRG